MIKKLENKSKFDEKFNRYDTDKIITKKVGIKNEFSYLINNQIINKQIHNALMHLYLILIYIENWIKFD